MTDFPTDQELREMGIYINCPDCGEFLWDAKAVDFRKKCPSCGWPEEEA